MPSEGFYSPALIYFAMKHVMDQRKQYLESHSKELPPIFFAHSITYFYHSSAEPLSEFAMKQG